MSVVAMFDFEAFINLVFQGSKNLSSSHLEQVDFPSGQVPFHSRGKGSAN